MYFCLSTVSYNICISAFKNKRFVCLMLSVVTGQVSVGAEASDQASGSQSTAKQNEIRVDELLPVRYPRRKRSKPNYYGHGP